MKDTNIKFTNPIEFLSHDKNIISILACNKLVNLGLDITYEEALLISKLDGNVSSLNEFIDKKLRIKYEDDKRSYELCKRIG